MLKVNLYNMDKDIFGLEKQREKAEDAMIDRIYEEDEQDYLDFLDLIDSQREEMKKETK